MNHCPHCGAVMRDVSDTCAQCGSEYDTEADRSESRAYWDTHRRIQRPASRDSDSEHESLPTADEGVEGEKTDGAADSRGDAVSEQTAATRPSRIGRRELLLGGVGGIALLGTLAVLREESDDAAAVVRQFYEALGQADVDTARDLVHDNAPRAGGLVNVSQAYLRQRSFTIESLTRYASEDAPDQGAVRQFIYFSVVVTITTSQETTGPNNQVAEQMTVAENTAGRFRIWRV